VQRNSHPIGLRTWKKKVRILLSSVMSSAKKQTFNSLNFRHPQYLNPFHKWRRICRYGLIWLMTLLLAIAGYHPPGMTQAITPFVCSRTLYITQATGTADPIQLNSVNTSTSNLNLTPVGGTTAGVRYNAVGFNAVDGFIYGIDPDPIGVPPGGQPEGRTVYRIDRNGAVTSIGVPPGLPNQGLFFSGDVDRNGVYYILNRDLNQLFRLNVTGQTTATVIGQPVTLTVPAGTNFTDVAFNPVDDQLYGFDNTSGRLAVIDVNTGAVTFFGATTTGRTVGGAFFDAFGNFFAYDSDADVPYGQLLVTTDVANPNNPNRGVFTTLGAATPVNRFDGASCAFAPILDKSVSPTPIQAGGIVTYTYRVANTNSFALEGLTFTDTFTDGRTYIAGTLTLSSVTGNPPTGTPNNFGGTPSLQITNLTIPPRSIAQIGVQVQIPLTIPPGVVTNQATISGIPNNFGGPNISSDFLPTGAYPDPTLLQVTAAPPTPRIGLAKRVASSVNLGNGVFRVTYELVVRNQGNVDLNNVQVTEDLTTTFAQATSFTVSPNSVSSPSGNLAPNPNYNGRTDTNLLAGTDALVVGQSKTIQFVVDVTPGANLGPYNNQAVARGTAPNGQTVEDPSQNGTNPDPDGDGNPGNNSDPTPVSFAANPVLGVAKSVASVVDAGNGNSTVTYSIRAQNLGDVPLNNLQLTENLVTTFGSVPFTVNRVSAPQGNLTPNPNYNGRTDLNLLAGTDTLALGETKTLELVVTITPPNERRTFTNQVEGTATSPTGQTVRDLSQNGINPDPDSDRNPTNNDVPTPLVIGPNLRLVKRITNITRGGAPVSGVDFTSFTPDPGDDDDDVSGWSNLPGGVLSGVYNLGSNNALQTGDEVEYTVYYLSDGTQSVSDVKICDPIPDKTTFIPDSFQLGQGILLNQQATNTSLTNASDTDRGTFFSRLTPVTSPCPNTNNANGSVLVDVGNLTTTAPNNVGFIRFRVKID
jgi:uncharacterized repeat protein (TIGR01451 family)